MEKAISRRRLLLTKMFDMSKKKGITLIEHAAKAT